MIDFKENRINNSISLTRVASLMLLLLFIILFLYSIFFESIAPLYLYSIFINVFVIFLFRKNPSFLLFYIFCLFYTLSLIPYYFFDLDVSLWKDFNERKYYDIVVRIYSCFLVTPLVFNHRKYLDFIEQFKIPHNPNILGFITFFSICIFVIIFGQSGSNVFESGGYATGDSSKSSMYEYYILFFFIAYYYSNRRKSQLILLISLGIVYIIKSLLYGGRIEVIQYLILTFYILIVDYKVKISPFKIILGCLIFYYVNLVFGSIRSNPVPLLEGNYIAYLSPFQTYSDPNTTYISSNEGDVIQSSVRLIGLIENGLLDVVTRIKALAGFIFSIVVPSSWLPEEASLITYKKDIYNSGGGGLIAVYFYAFLGWVGPFIISGYLFLLYTLTKKTQNFYLKLYFLMVFSTFPRWFAYNPIILFKLCLWIIPLVFVSNLIFNYKRKSRVLK